MIRNSPATSKLGNTKKHWYIFCFHTVKLYNVQCVNIIIFLQGCILLIFPFIFKNFPFFSYFLFLFYPFFFPLFLFSSLFFLTLFFFSLPYNLKPSQMTLKIPLPLLVGLYRTVNIRHCLLYMFLFYLLILNIRNPAIINNSVI